MFEAQLEHGSLWKKVVEAIKDLVNDVNLDCSPSGISLQAMDSAHIALVNLLLKGEGFTNYRCERNVILGLNLASLSRVMKATDNSERITFRHEDDTDQLSIMCETPGSQKVSEYQLKLMEIEGEQLVIPEQEYKAKVSMSSAEFSKLCRDMAIFADTVTVEVTSAGVKFSASGDIGEASTLLKASTHTADERKKVVKGEAKIKPEKTEDGDEPVKKPIKKEKEDTAATEKSEDTGVHVELEENVTLSFPLRYFTIFARGGSLSDRVVLHMAKDCPCLVEYQISGLGFLRFYSAPKVNEDEQA